MADRLFNVVIEQPRSPAPGAAAALAAAISARYGIPAGDLERRIARGRFRVKSKVDRATADTYAADLTRLGAVCIIQPVEDASTSVVASMPSVSAQMPAVSAPPDFDGMALPQGNRDPAPRPALGRNSGRSDGRWFWALALALLALETGMRRSTRVASSEVAHADAA